VSFKNRTNTSIYVKGLPEDISFEEMKEFFLKAGILKIDPETNLEKVKIYTDE
jgi:HIV Tat-specific factor 1